MAIAFRAVSANVTWSNVTSLTLAAPAGTQPNDIMIAVVGGTGASRSTNFTVSAPAGWTLVEQQQDATNFGDMAVFWALGSVSNFAFTLSGSNSSGSGFILAYSGVDNTTPMDATGVGQNNTTASTTETAPSITTVNTNTMLVGAYLWFVTGTVALPSYSAEFGTHRQNGGISGGRGGSSSLDVADAAQAATGASGTKTVTASSSQKSIGILAALREAPPIVLRTLSLLGVGI